VHEEAMAHWGLLPQKEKEDICSIDCFKGVICNPSTVSLSNRLIQAVITVL
jgi:hypothetical protein